MRERKSRGTISEIYCLYTLPIYASVLSSNVLLQSLPVLENKGLGSNQELQFDHFHIKERFPNDFYPGVCSPSLIWYHYGFRHL